MSPKEKEFYKAELLAIKLEIREINTTDFTDIARRNRLLTLEQKLTNLINIIDTDANPKN